MAESAPPLRIALVGGGIAGLSTAIGIVNAQKSKGAQVELRIFEQAGKFGEIGAGVSIGPNASLALALMGAPDLLTKAAGANADDDLETWFDFRIGDRNHKQAKEYICTVKSQVAGSSNINVHRADFLNEVIARLPSHLATFGQRCTSYTPHASGITLHFKPSSSAPTASPTSYEADVLICTDGIRSRLREHLYTRKGLEVQSQVAQYAEWVAWRGLIPVEKYEEVMGKGAKKKVMLCGPQKHILTFPVRRGELVNIVAFVQDPHHRKLGGHKGPWTEERPQAEMLDDFADFGDDCLALLKAIEKPSIWGIFALPPLEEILDERVVLIGDAAHSMTPHQGAGAGQAIEDALFISTLLTHPSVCSSSMSTRPARIQHALEIYKSARHVRGLAVQKTSWEAGKLYEYQGVNGEGSDLARMKESLENRLRWIWEEDLEKSLKEAVDRLQ